MDRLDGKEFGHGLGSQSAKEFEAFERILNIRRGDAFTYRDENHQFWGATVANVFHDRVSTVMGLDVPLEQIVAVREY